MLTKVHIENFKSIYNETIELGRVNVFIGENGSGKSNVLEALALASAAKSGRLKNNDFAQKGIRVARPDMMISSFLGNKQKNEIIVDCELDYKIPEYLKNIVNTKLKIPALDDIFAKWEDDYSLEFIVIDHHERESKSLTIKQMKAEILEGKSFLEETNLWGYLIYALETTILRGIGGSDKETPGRNGENLDLLINSFNKEEFAQLVKHSYFISWLADNGIVLDKDRNYEGAGHKLNNSKSILYFRDKFMQRKNNLFSSENANEGVLHILFYLALFISKHTPKFFAIDNIETALNPQLCRALMTELATLAKTNNKQALITTHNPAILDGLNLHDDEQRLFVVKRNKKGHTKVERIELKPDAEIGGTRLKLSELWMRNMIGGLPQNF